ncbi:MAG: M15 family metallopeptidase [Caldisericia bacterium]|nr:M15 family metallopeptidase [Caldisericia bacterium]
MNDSFDLILKFIETPIPKIKKENWDEIRSIKIIECNENLVPLNLYPEKIINHPEYFIEGLKNSFPICFTRESIYEKLIKASELLPEGYKFVIFDAYRPVELQQSLFDSYKEKLKKENPNLNEEELVKLTLNFVALPSYDENKPSPHNTGGAIDLSICDNRGRLLNMGTYFDEMCEKANTRYFEEKLERGENLSDEELEILKNRRLLFHIMTYFDFTNFSNEWWHYDFGDQLWAYHKGKNYAIYGRTKPRFFFYI